MPRANKMAPPTGHPKNLSRCGTIMDRKAVEKGLSEWEKERRRSGPQAL